MQRSTRIIRKGKQKRNKQSEERYPEPWGGEEDMALYTTGLGWVRESLSFIFLYWPALVWVRRHVWNHRRWIRTITRDGTRIRFI